MVVRLCRIKSQIWWIQFGVLFIIVKRHMSLYIVCFWKPKAYHRGSWILIAWNKLLIYKQHDQNSLRLNSIFYLTVIKSKTNTFICFISKWSQRSLTIPRQSFVTNKVIVEHFLNRKKSLIQWVSFQMTLFVMQNAVAASIFPL